MFIGVRYSVFPNMCNNDKSVLSVSYQPNYGTWPVIYKSDLPVDNIVNHGGWYAQDVQSFVSFLHLSRLSIRVFQNYLLMAQP